MYTRIQRLTITYIVNIMFQAFLGCNICTSIYGNKDKCNFLNHLLGSRIQVGIKLHMRHQQCCYE